MSYVQRLVVLLAVVASGVLAPSCSRNETNGSGEKQTEVRQVTDANESVTRPVVVIETSMGTIKAELWADKAPKTVANFLTYVDDKFYDGLIFHRVIPKFMIRWGQLRAIMLLPSNKFLNDSDPRINQVDRSFIDTLS